MAKCAALWRLPISKAACRTFSISWIPTSNSNSKTKNLYSTHTTHCALKSIKKFRNFSRLHPKPLLKSARPKHSVPRPLPVVITKGLVKTEPVPVFSMSTLTTCPHAKRGTRKIYICMKPYLAIISRLRCSKN